MNLEQVKRLQEEQDEKYRVNPDYQRIPIDITCEIRWFARIGSNNYALINDWTTQQLDRKLWESEQSTER